MLDLESLRDILGGGVERASCRYQTSTQETGPGWTVSGLPFQRPLQQGGGGEPLKRVGWAPKWDERGDNCQRGHSSLNGGIVQAAKS